MSYVNQNRAFARVFGTVTLVTGAFLGLVGFGVWPMCASVLMFVSLSSFNRGLARNRPRKNNRCRWDPWER